MHGRRGPRAHWLLVALAPFALAGSCRAPEGPDGARALERVKWQVAQGPRIPGEPGSLAVRDWLAAEMGRLGGRVERQAFADTLLGRIWPLENVIGRFGPSTGRRIALFAHYDTRPWSDEDPDTSKRNQPVAGANDGASGVAVLLEVAEVLSRQAPSVGVDLVFLDGEDYGRAGDPESYSRGSQGYARRLPARGDPARPVAGFLFDLVGDADLGIWDEAHSALRATNLVELVHEAARATAARHFHPEVRHIVIDDHIPLLDAGLPTVNIIDFDYPAWHTTRDLPDQVSAESLAEVSRVAIWLVYRSALARP